MATDQTPSRFDSGHPDEDAPWDSLTPAQKKARATAASSSVSIYDLDQGEGTA